MNSRVSDSDAQNTPQTTQRRVDGGGSFVCPGERSARGFGGLEMLINVAILGIIFVLLLKAEDGINYARGVFEARQIETMQIIILGYREDHSFLPGDDPLAPRRFRREPAFTRTFAGGFADLTNNDVIDGYLFDAENEFGEHFRAWQDLRYAGKLGGEPEMSGMAALPGNLSGGVYGLDSGNLGMEDGSLCSTNLPGITAQVVDDSLDDGNIQTGLVVGTARLPEIPDDQWGHYDEPDSEPYDPEKRYMICTTQLPL